MVDLFCKKTRKAQVALCYGRRLLVLPPLPADADLVRLVSDCLTSERDLLHVRQVCTHWRPGLRPSACRTLYRPWVVATTRVCLAKPVQRQVPVGDYSLWLFCGLTRIQLAGPPGLPYCFGHAAWVAGGWRWRTTSNPPRGSCYGSPAPAPRSRSRRWPTSSRSSSPPTRSPRRRRAGWRSRRRPGTACSTTYSSGGPETPRGVRRPRCIPVSGSTASHSTEATCTAWTP